MTESDLLRIEHELSVELPQPYASQLRSYPFSGDSYVAESYLWNDPRVLIDSNTDLESIIGGAKADVDPHAHMFQIGSDGGEEIYLIDLRHPTSPIYVYDFERGSITEKCPDLEAWLMHCREAEAEVVADEAKMAEIRANRRWWEFWK